MRAEYLKFVWGFPCLPNKFEAEIHNISVHEREEGHRPPEKDKKGKIIKEGYDYVNWEIDSLPKSHTCTFQLHMPYFTSSQMMEEKLRMSIEMARGIEDWAAALNLK